MSLYKYIILGAGPAGLTFANLLKKHGETSFLVLEAKTNAGGLCRSTIVDDSPLDIGGGHFLDVCRPKVNNFLFSFMPENEWDLYNRNSKIDINGMIIDHPIEANIWQMNIDKQIEYLKSIATAGCNQGNLNIPERFVDWIYWKFGESISNDYMIPYNSKIFSKNLNELGTYWLDKLPNVSFEDTLRSCLTHKAYGKQPGHAQFYYPKKYGYGELWERMASVIKDHIIYNACVDGIDFSSTTVYCSDGNVFSGNIIITTIPWCEFKSLKGMPDYLVTSIQKLKYSSIQVEYFPENIDTDAHWIYYPNKDLEYHRILVRHNFCPNSRGHWTETNCERLKTPKAEYSFYNKYAYPLNTIDKPRIMKQLTEWSKLQNVYALGRWGEHSHYNSDVTVMRAMDLFEKIK